MVLDAILSLSYTVLILGLSFIITLLSTIIYKLVTDQNKIKNIKAESKKLQQEMKKHKDDQKKVMQIQKEMFAKNSEVMKQSFKPMLYTFIPLILILSWMSATLAYQPLEPGVPFTVTAQLEDTYAANYTEINLSSQPSLQIERNPNFAQPNQIQWIVSGQEEGPHTLLIQGPMISETKDVLITTDKDYEEPVKKISDGPLKQIVVGNKEVKINFGIFTLNWLWSYIIFSVILSFGLRKLMKVA